MKFLTEYRSVPGYKLMCGEIEADSWEEAELKAEELGETLLGEIFEKIEWNPEEIPEWIKEELDEF